MDQTVAETLLTSLESRPFPSHWDGYNNLDSVGFSELLRSREHPEVEGATILLIDAPYY